MRHLSALSLICGVVLGTAAVAEAETITANWACTFMTECFEQESCSATDYDVSVSYDIDALKGKPGEGSGTAEITDVTATRRAIVLHDNGAFVASAVDFTSDATIAPTFQVFAAASGDARLVSTDPLTPMLITYHGTCVQGSS